MAKQPNSVSSGGESFMVKLATFIVDKRNLFFLITIILVIFSMFSRGWVEVEANHGEQERPPGERGRDGWLLRRHQEAADQRRDLLVAAILAG